MGFFQHFCRRITVQSFRHPEGQIFSPGLGVMGSTGHQEQGTWQGETRQPNIASGGIGGGGMSITHSWRTSSVHILMLFSATWKLSTPLSSPLSSSVIFQPIRGSYISTPLSIHLKGSHLCLHPVSICSKWIWLQKLRPQNKVIWQKYGNL